MKKVFNGIYILMFVCFVHASYGMDSEIGLLNPINRDLIPQEAIAQLAGYCEPQEKNILMKVCCALNICLKNRELIVAANPSTVNLEDKINGMFRCARLGDVRNLSIWLKVIEKEHINSENILKLTAFQVALMNKHANVMRLLREYGASLFYEAHVHPLLQAVYNDDNELVATLLDLGCYMFFRQGTVTPLYVAISENNSDMVQLLCTHGNYLPDKCKEMSPLYYAASKGYFEIVKILLEVGKFTSSGDHQKPNPLLVASSRDDIHVVQLLLNYGANIHQVDNVGWTPLHMASHKGCVDMVQFLLEKGACVSLEDHRGHTPLYVAVKAGHKEVAKLLLARLEPSGDLFATVKKIFKS